MKKTIITIVVLMAIWLAWSAWPFFALYDLARAAQTGDAAQIERRVDFPLLQRSFTDQILTAYQRVTGKRVQRGLLGAAAGAVVDPFIAKLATPEAFAALLRDGWPKGIAEPPPPGFAAPNLTALGNIFRLYAASDYGIGEFRITLPLDGPAEHRFRLQLALANWTWRLIALDLPPELADRLAREIANERG
jgi:hypothetical protein